MLANQSSNASSLVTKQLKQLNTLLDQTVKLCFSLLRFGMCALTDTAKSAKINQPQTVFLN